MNTIEIPGKGFFEYPSCWEDHTIEQHDFALQNLVKLNDEKIDYYYFKSAILYKFLGLKHTPVSQKKEKYMGLEERDDKYENIYLLLETLNYFFREEKGKLVLNYNCTKQFIPRLKYRRNIFYGPDDAFINLTFREILDSMNHYNAYNKDKNYNDLDKLIAVLYRPEKENYKKIKERSDFDGERRVNYNPATVNSRAEIIREIPFYKKFGVFLYYKACLEHITSNTIEVDNKIINLSRLFNKGGENAGGIGMLGTLYGVAESGIFGDIDKTSERNIYDILLLLFKNMEEAEELKRKYKQND